MDTNAEPALLTWIGICRVSWSKYEVMGWHTASKVHGPNLVSPPDILNGHALLHYHPIPALPTPIDHRQTTPRDATGKCGIVFGKRGHRRAPKLQMTSLDSARLSYSYTSA